MNTIMAVITNIILSTLAELMPSVAKIYGKLNLMYADLLKSLNIPYIKLKYLILIVFVIVVTLALIICFIIIASHHKKRKIYFYADKDLVEKSKAKLGNKITFPEDDKLKRDGEVFVGWFKDKDLTQAYVFDSLVKNKNLHLYAKYEKDESVLIEEKDVTVLNNYNPIGDNNAEESQIVEEKIEINRALLEIGDLYDLIRYEMLSYERATPFKNLGVERKQVVAEMFEKDNKIHLYLAVDPDLMKEKGYKVEKYTELEFQIVPCKKIVENYADYEEAVKLIKEAMIINNFIKSDVSIANKIKSDETVRRSGFAFFVKNEVVVTTASQYYILLRSIVLSYKLSALRKYPEGLDNKMILKIFKKDERIFLYLALNAEKEGLDFVGYDKNFADTPAMLEIKSADDCNKAQSLIDKLMFYYGMEKYPDQAVISLDETLETNCGFGYRIRR